MLRKQSAIERLNGVAIDFGGTKILAARVANGVVEKPVTAKTDGNADVDGQIDAMVSLLGQLALGPDERVGVAVSGRVSSDGIWFSLNSETLTSIDAVPLRALLSERLARNVDVENDAIAAAIGEHIAGAGRGARSMAYITVSTGVGGGLILNNRPLITADGLAGHVGFTTSRHATRLCGCGRAQTVESVASGRAIAAYADAAGYSGYDAKQVYEAHLAGQEWAKALIRQSASAIAELCANLKSLLDLDRIVLGGSIGLAAGYLDIVLEALLSEPPIFQPQIVASELRANAALIGVLAAV